MSKWKVNKNGFIEAIMNNKYAEYAGIERCVLITDMDSEPYLYAPAEMDKQEVDDLVVEEDWFVTEGIVEGREEGIWHIEGFEVTNNSGSSTQTGP